MYIIAVRGGTEKPAILCYMQAAKYSSVVLVLLEPWYPNLT